eukprot:m.339924 g.339924  ORF g.339924 m.339924 type:complete len:63 (-) comp27822_c2_seq6:1525-1713(-)
MIVHRSLFHVCYSAALITRGRKLTMQGPARCASVALAKQSGGIGAVGVTSKRSSSVDSAACI